MQNHTGKKFGRLTVIFRAPNGKHNTTKWACVCECGTAKVVAAADLVTGHTKSCGCLKKDLAPYHKRLRPFEATYNILRSVAKNEGRECKISYKQFIKFTETGNCHYCDATIPWGPYVAGKSGAYYLDRKDNKKPYTVKNCAVCCSRCNWAKANRFSYEEWKVAGSALRKFREGQWE